MTIRSFLDGLKAEAQKQNEESAERLAAIAEIEQVIAGVTDNVTHNPPVQQGAESKAGKAGGEDSGNRMAADAGSSPAEGSSATKSVTNPSSIQRPEPSTDLHLDKIDWRNNSKGWWIFADNPDAKNLREKIGPQKGNVFKDGKYSYHVSSSVKDGKTTVFINRTVTP